MRYIFALILLTSPTAFAFDITPEGIYSATKEACLKLSPEVLLGTSAEQDQLRAGYFPSRKFTELMTAIRSDSFHKTLKFNVTEMSQYAELMLKSPDFERALNECYPDSPAAQNYFRISVKRSDQAGKFVGVSAVILMYQTGGEVIGVTGTLLARWSQLAYRVFDNANRALFAVSMTSFFTSDSAPSTNLKEEPITLPSVSKLNPEAQDHMTQAVYQTSLLALLRFFESQLVSETAQFNAQTQPEKKQRLLEKIAETKKSIELTQEQLKALFIQSKDDHS